MSKFTSWPRQTCGASKEEEDSSGFFHNQIVEGNPFVVFHGILLRLGKPSEPRANSDTCCTIVALVHPHAATFKKSLTMMHQAGTNLSWSGRRDKQKKQTPAYPHAHDVSCCWFLHTPFTPIFEPTFMLFTFTPIDGTELCVVCLWVFWGVPNRLQSLPKTNASYDLPSDKIIRCSYIDP